jgi:phosphatidylglycerophosphatase A
MTEKSSNSLSSVDISRPLQVVARKPTMRFVFSHPAHAIAIGFGSGLSPVAPGTAGTLWAWLVHALFAAYLTPLQQGIVLALSAVVGWWACTVTARHLAVADPAAVVWDEIVGFWLVLWLVTPAGFWAQACAFVLFRVFDAAKPGPVAWADALYKVRRGRPIGWAQGFSILLDDIVAALCALFLIAVWRAI